MSRNTLKLEYEAYFYFLGQKPAQENDLNFARLTSKFNLSIFRQAVYKTN